VPMPDDIPDDAPDEAPDDVSDDSLGDVPDDAPDDTPGEAPDDAPEEAAVPPAPPKRRHRVRNSILAVVGVVTVVAVGLAVAAAYDVHTLTRNLKHTTLLPPGVTQPAEAVDAYGDSALNILLIGSDTRDTSQDADLGGDGGSGANADSEMIVHLSADRSNATILSIPRDTVTQLPQCAGGGEGMINSALQYGAACQVEAAHELTGLTIDHYVMFDFSGVVSISKDVGGIPVCVSANIQDPNSSLRLYKGTTKVEGIQALEFLRTRDAFYDGSDIGRERATHYFFTQLIQQMKASASFTNLGQLQSLAEDVTKSTTVDNGLDSVTALIDLGEDLNKVPSDRITFLIMPWGQDPDNVNRVVPQQPAAQDLFADIAADKSFTADSSGTGTGGSSPSPSASPAPAAIPSAAAAATSPTGAPSGSASGSESGSPSASDSSAALKASESAAARAHPMQVAVVNSSGTTGRSDTIVQELFADGFVYVSGSDATTTVTATTLVYEPSEAAAAQELATDLGLPSSALTPTGTTGKMILTIGTDWSSGATYPAATASAGPSISVPNDSYEQNAGATGGCITANPADEF
jgi:LCP family protein required for cell wall assembly